MLGMGYFLGIASIFANRTRRSFLPQLQAGVLIPEAIECYTSSRCAHFSGGAGMKLPQFKEFKSYDFGNLQTWDSKLEQSYLIDPESNLKHFEACTSYIMETEFKEGYRLNLIANNFFIDYLRTKVFDFSFERENTVVYRKTGAIVTKEEFDEEMAKFRPALDQVFLEEGLIKASDIVTLKAWLKYCLSAEMCEVIEKALVFDSSVKWGDSKYFSLAEIDEMISEMVRFSQEYFHKRYMTRR